MNDRDTETYRRDSSNAPRARTRARTRERMDTRRVRTPLERGIVAAALIVLGVVVLAVGVDLATSAGRVHPGVRIGGVNVGGMTPANAKAALQLRLPDKAKTPVTVVYDPEQASWEISADDLGLSYDYDGLVGQAMAVGRGGIAGSVGERIGAWFGRAHLPALANANQAKLHDKMAEIAAELDKPARDAKVVIGSQAVTTKPSAPGSGVDRAALAPAILAAFASSERTVRAPYGSVSPRIDDAAAQSAKTVVEGMIAAPATVTLGEKRWDISTAELGKMISFRTVNATAVAGVAPSAVSSSGWVLDPYVSANDASRTIAPKLGKGIGQPSRDASFATRNGQVSIVPSKTGVGPDFESLAESLTQALKTDPSVARVVALRTRKSEPKISTEMARGMGIRERISTFTTVYSAGNRPRVNNIHLLGDAIDGKLIAPGETFSFNGSVGERTAAKGYVEANAIVDGKLVPQLGGGICQVGTTLFNTVYIAGLPIVERHNHSFFISHYPAGRDATVSWGGPDLRFKNDTKDWILISVSYTNSSITMSLYGTDPGYKVTSVTGPFTDEHPFSTETIKDPKLPVGSKIVEDPGVTGRTCVVKRKVTLDGKVIREDSFKSVYRPKGEVVRVGTKPKSSKPATDSAG